MALMIAVRSLPSLNSKILCHCIGSLIWSCDTAPGAIIPAAEAFYHVDYSIIAMIFVAIAVGFISAAFSVDFLDRWMRRGKLLAVCDLISIVGYVMMAVTPPFPVYVVG